MWKLLLCVIETEDTEDNVLLLVCVIKTEDNVLLLFCVVKTEDNIKSVS